MGHDRVLVLNGPNQARVPLFQLLTFSLVQAILTIVITNFQSFLFLLHLLLLTHFGDTPEDEIVVPPHILAYLEGI